MDGLVKLAWTKKRISNAVDDFYKVHRDAQESDALTTEEKNHLMNHLKKKGLDVVVGINEEYDPRDNSFFRNRNSLLKYKEKLKNQNPEDDSGADSFIRSIDMDNTAKDGLVISKPSKSTITHELGHAIAYKRHPILENIPSVKLSRMENAGLTGGVGLLAARLNGQDETNEEREQNFSLDSQKLIGTAAATGVGAGGLTMLSTYPTIADENRANRYAQNLFRDTFDKETADKYINQTKPLHAAALNTYKQLYLRNIKNSAIAGAVGGGLGYGAGLGLNFLTDQTERDA